MTAPIRVRYSHQAMADMIIENPAISQNQLASVFGYTPGWVSQVINSDGFQAYLEGRKSELVDPMLRASIEERLRGLMVKSVDVLQERLATDPNTDVALKALEIGSRALGYGARQNNVQVNASFVVALPAKVASSAEWAERVSPAPALIEAK